MPLNIFLVSDLTLGNHRALPVAVPYPPWLLLLVLRVPQATDTQLSRLLLDFPPPLGLRYAWNHCKISCSTDNPLISFRSTFLVGSTFAGTLNLWITMGELDTRLVASGQREVIGELSPTDRAQSHHSLDISVELMRACQ